MRFSSNLSTLALAAAVSAQSIPGTSYDFGVDFPGWFRNLVSSQRAILLQPTQVASTPSFESNNSLDQSVAADHFQAPDGTTAHTSMVQTSTATGGSVLPSGFSSTSVPAGAVDGSDAPVDSVSPDGTTLSGSSSSIAGAPPTIPTSTSAASDSDFEAASQLFVKGVCVAVAATIPWIW